MGEGYHRARRQKMLCWSVWCWSVFWCMAVPGVEKCFVGQIGVGHLLGANRGAKQASTNLIFVLMYALD